MDAVGAEMTAFHPSPRGRFASHLHNVLRVESRRPFWDTVDNRPRASRPPKERYGKATDLIITNFHTGGVLRVAADTCPLFLTKRSIRISVCRISLWPTMGAQATEIDYRAHQFNTKRVRQAHVLPSHGLVAFESALPLCQAGDHSSRT